MKQNSTTKNARWSQWLGPDSWLWTSLKWELNKASEQNNLHSYSRNPYGKLTSPTINTPKIM